MRLFGVCATAKMLINAVFSAGAPNARPYCCVGYWLACPTACPPNRPSAYSRRGARSARPPRACFLMQKTWSGSPNSCVAATYRVDCVAATQLFIFDGDLEDLWPRAPHGALAIGYYCWRGYAAFLPLRGLLAFVVRLKC